MCHTDSELIGILASLADDANETTPAPDCSQTSTASSAVNAALNDFPPPQSDDANLPATVDADQPSTNDVTAPAHNSSTFGSFEIPPSLHEESMEDALPDNIAPEEFPHVIEYQTIESSSQRGNCKLVDNIGYSYTAKRKYDEGNIVWRCTVRNKTTTCLATVRQHGTTYTPGLQKHSHQPSAGTGTAAKLNAHACPCFTYYLNQLIIIYFPFFLDHQRGENQGNARPL